MDVSGQVDAPANLPPPPPAHGKERPAHIKYVAV